MQLFRKMLEHFARFRKLVTASLGRREPLLQINHR
jgi:hypothetical protein